MKLRTLAVATACTLLLQLSAGLPGSPFTSQAQAQDTVVDVMIQGEATTLDFAVVDGNLVPVYVAGEILDAFGGHLGTYEESWQPAFDSSGNFVGLNSVATYNFDGTDPALNGTLTAVNFTTVLGLDSTGFFTDYETTGQITDATGGLAGTTGDVDLSSEASAMMGYFFSVGTLTLQLPASGPGNSDFGHSHKKPK